MKRMFLVLLSACASDTPAPVEPAPRTVERMQVTPSQTATASYADLARASHDEAERQARAALDQPRIEEERRRKLAAEAEAQKVKEQANAAATHESECKASFPSRLRSAQGLLAQVPTKKAAIQNRCRSIQPRCVIAGGRSACVGVSADDASFYESVCMSLPYASQIPMIDESDGCDDVDPVSLHVSFAATPAEMDPIRNAKP